MEPLTTIRDLVYQERYSEANALFFRSPDSSLAKAYINGNSNCDLQYKATWGDIGCGHGNNKSYQCGPDRDGRYPGYGDYGDGYPWTGLGYSRVNRGNGHIKGYHIASRYVRLIWISQWYK